MKKANLKFFKRAAAFFLAVPFVLTLTSCEEEPPPAEDPIASFQYAISETNFLEVSFTNFSQNATSYSWDFGDQSGTSTEESPTYTYGGEGTYTVELTAVNADGVEAKKTETFTLTDPNTALRMLTGDVSKVWKINRNGVAMSLGPDATNPGGWWEGFQNTGARPCLYKQEWEFFLDGTLEFDDKGVFWGEFGVWNDTEYFEKCFEPSAATMVNKDGADVSKWGTGTHAFTYDAAAGTLTLTGEGAWIGIPKLATAGESAVPSSSVTTNVAITEETGYSTMVVTFDYGAGGFWTINYISYTDAGLEPDIVEVAPPFGEDLDDVTPTEIKVTFASRDAADLVTIDTIQSGSTVVFGVDDPLDAGAAKVGQFNRTGAQYQELQFQTKPAKDIQFDNFNQVSVEVLVEAGTDFTTMKREIRIGFGDISQTEGGWWNDNTEDMKALDAGNDGAWTTYTFDISGAKARTDLDMVYLQIGGGDHTAEDVFYVRNMMFSNVTK